MALKYMVCFQTLSFFFLFAKLNKKKNQFFFLKTFNTVVYEGVKRKEKGLSLSFNMKYEHCKQMVRLTKTSNNRKPKGQSQPFTSIYRLPTSPIP